MARAAGGGRARARDRRGVPRRVSVRRGRRAGERRVPRAHERPPGLRAGRVDPRPSAPRRCAPRSSRRAGERRVTGTAGGRRARGHRLRGARLLALPQRGDGARAGRAALALARRARDHAARRYRVSRRPRPLAAERGSPRCSESSSHAASRPGRGGPCAGLSSVLVLVHLVLAPLSSLRAMATLGHRGRASEAIASRLADVALPDGRVFLVASDPDVFLYPRGILAAVRPGAVQCTSILSAAHAGHRFTRVDARTLAGRADRAHDARRLLRHPLPRETAPSQRATRSASAAP